MKGFGYVYSPWAGTFFGSPRRTKLNTDFEKLQGVYFSEKYGGLSELIAFVQNWGILLTRMVQRCDHMKMSLDYFKYNNECYKHIEWKVDEKMGSFFEFPCLPPELWSLHCPKKCIFLQFYAYLSKKQKSVKIIYIHVPESSHYTHSENGMIYRGLSRRSWDISNQNIKKDTDSAEN